MKDKFNPTAIRLIIGLGNPGAEYANTYHNLGFLFTDAFVEHFNPAGRFKKYIRGNFSYAEIEKIAVVKPGTFMNVSGASAKRALSFFKASPENMMVVHDDNDIPFGKYKIDFDRGAAGHNGVSSVIERVGTKAFWRCRLGIQKPEWEKRKKAGDFVLTPLSPKDKKTAEAVFLEIIGNHFT